jgi:hypothetical protein
LIDANHDRKMAAIDFFGAFLALSGSALLVLALTWAGGEHTWNSSHVVASLVVGIFTSICFVFWQWKGTVVPLVPSMSLSQSVPNHSHELTIPSGDLQKTDGEWSDADHVCEWLGVSGPDLLRALLLPVGLRLLGGQVRRFAITNHPDAE